MSHPLSVDEVNLRRLFLIDGKVTLVTGGSSGFDRRIAECFVRGGAKVYISSPRRHVCERVTAELAGHGTCVAVPADRSHEAACQHLAIELADGEPRANVLVNNAGATRGAPMEGHDIASWRRVLDLNVKAVFHLTKHLLPRLQAASTANDPAK